MGKSSNNNTRPQYSAGLNDFDETAFHWQAGKKIIDDFEVKRVLGIGGMGAVYLVKRLTSRKDYFAVKTLRKAILDDKQKKRLFLRELRTWIDLPDHPHLAACRFFRTIEDRLAIFSEYIDGGSLHDWIKTGKVVKLADILDIAIQIAWGIQAAHDCGVIHQDIKPSNVLMTMDGIAKVTDFGIARAKDTGDADAPVPDGNASILVTSNGMTIAYCSPEQALNEKLSFKTDIWSWGVSVLEMFTGRITWKVGSLVEMVLEEYCINESDIFRTEMPKSVRKVLERCFKSNPDDRWDNMNDVVERLVDIYLIATGEKYFRDPPAEIAKKQVRHSLLDRSTGTRKTWHNPKEWLEKVLLEAGRDPDKMSDIIPTGKGSRKAQALIDLELYVSIENILLELIDNGRIEYKDELARLLNNKAFICESLDDIPGAISEYDRSIKIREYLVIDEDRIDLKDELAWVYMNKAGTLFQQDDTENALILYDKILAIWEPLLHQDISSEIIRNITQVYMNKAMVVSEVEKPEEVISLYDKAIQVCLKYTDPDESIESSNSLARIYLNKSVALTRLGEYKEAIELSDKAVQIREKLVYKLGQDNLMNGLSNSYSNKALALWFLGEYKKASQLYSKAIDINEKLVFQNERSELAPGLARAYLNKACALKDMGEDDRALAFYDKGIELKEHIVYDKHVTTFIYELAGAYTDKAVLLIRKKRFIDAMDLCDQAIEILQKMIYQDKQTTLTEYLVDAYFNKAISLNSINQSNKAIHLFTKAIQLLRDNIKKSSSNENFHKLLRMRVYRADALLKSNKGHEAKLEIQEIYPLLQEEFNRTGYLELKNTLELVQKIISYSNKSH